MSNAPESRRVLVTVGTDFHPFDRLVAWADMWARSNPEAQVVVQHGSSQPPQVAEGCAFFTPEQLHKEMDAADIVVTHGGPATITEARRRHRVPVCVPRDPNLGEHVDDHQQRFARFLNSRGLVRLASTDAEFVAALSDDAALHVVPEGEATGAASVPDGVTKVGEIVAQLVQQRRSS